VSSVNQPGRWTDCTTGKRRYGSERHARGALTWVNANADDVRPYKPTDVYRCSRCRGWHLTSRSRKPWKSSKSHR